MKHIRQMFAGLKSDKRGVTALEYGMIAAVLAVAIVTGFNTIGSNLSSQLSKIAVNVSSP